MISWYKVKVKIVCPISYPRWCLSGIMSIYHWYQDMIQTRHDTAHDISGSVSCFCIIQYHVGIMFSKRARYIMWYHVMIQISSISLISCVDEGHDISWYWRWYTMIYHDSDMIWDDIWWYLVLKLTLSCIEKNPNTTVDQAHIAVGGREHNSLMSVKL